jgi:hypothetical protein
VSVTVTSVHATDIGGLHDGRNVAVTASEKYTLPFGIGKSETRCRPPASSSEGACAASALH